MGKSQLEWFIFITYFSIIVPPPSCVFFSVGLSSLTRQGVKVSSVSWLHPTKPVENVVLTTKGLQESKHN